MTNFASRLRDVVEERGVTQAWLAEQANTTEATISRYMNGIHKPRIELVAAIAKALNVSADYLMGASLSPAPDAEPEREILILCDAYRRADDARKDIIWSALDPFLTAEEKTFMSQGEQGEAIAG